VFHQARPLSGLGKNDVVALLNYLAVERDVASSTQNQTLNALVFLFASVLERPLQPMAGIVLGKRPQRLPTILNATEVGNFLGEI
jgi:site-specific recombinase XerD